MNEFYIPNLVLSYYSVLIAVIGSLGNLICLVVCLQKRIRFIFRSFMVVLDTLGLYFWSFNDFNLTLFNKLPFLISYKMKILRNVN